MHAAVPNTFNFQNHLVSRSGFRAVFPEHVSMRCGNFGSLQGSSAANRRLRFREPAPQRRSGGMHTGLPRIKHGCRRSHNYRTAHRSPLDPQWSAIRLLRSAWLIPGKVGYGQLLPKSAIEPYRPVRAEGGPLS
jgi:hypothetical protein